MISIRTLSATLALSAALSLPLMATTGTTNTGPTKTDGGTSKTEEQVKPAADTPAPGTGARGKEKAAEKRVKERRSSADMGGYDGLLRGYGYRD